MHVPFTFQIRNKFVILRASGLPSFIFHVSRSLHIISRASGLVPPITPLYLRIGLFTYTLRIRLRAVPPFRGFAHTCIVK